MQKNNLGDKKACRYYSVEKDLDSGFADCMLACKDAKTLDKLKDMRTEAIAGSPNVL